jgi:hypothetical protein
MRLLLTFEVGILAGRPSALAGRSAVDADDPTDATDHPSAAVGHSTAFPCGRSLRSHVETADDDRSTADAEHRTDRLGGRECR